MRWRLLLLVLALLLAASCRGGEDEPAATAAATSSATPAPSASATAAATPSATAAPAPSATAEPTASVTPEPTASPTPEPTASVTPEPTASPTPEPTASATPEPTASPTPEPTASPTPEPTASATPEPTASPTPEPTASATPEPTASPTPEPTASPTPEPTPAALDLAALYAYGLALINEQRAAHGVRTLVLGTNTAAQSHAEDLAKHCTTSHWGADGLAPDMRYNLAGGFQIEGENVAGGACRGTPGDRFVDLERAMRQLLDSPGHRAALLRPQYRQVSMGIAGGRYLWWVQQFEGDYVTFTELPRLEGSALSFSGATRNGARIAPAKVLAFVRFYPLPQPIPASERAELGSHSLPPLLARVLPPGAPRTGKATDVVTTRFRLDGDEFAVTADLGDRMVGPGVYSLRLFGVVEGRHTGIAEYNIFAEAAPGSDPPLLPEPWVPDRGAFYFTEAPRLDGKVLSLAGRFGEGWGAAEEGYLLTIQHEWELLAFKRVGDKQGSPLGQRALWESAGPPLAWVVSPGSGWDEETPRLTPVQYSYDGRELALSVDLSEVLPDRGVATITLRATVGGGGATVAVVSVKIPPQ